MKHIYSCVAMLAVLANAAPAQTAASKQPAYIYLYARVTDHVNVNIAEDQLRHVLPMIERYRVQHADEHVSATILFTGAVSRALADRNSQTHIRDFVLDYIKRGVVEAGYDGTDEPTYSNRPTIDFTQAQTPQERWEVRKAAEEKFLTEGRDPLTGDPRPGTDGGLKEMQKVFGEAACITGLAPLMRAGPGGVMPFAVTRVKEPEPPGPKPVVLPPGLTPEVGGDTEAVLVVRNYNSKAIMFGLPDVNPARLPGFRGGRSGFSKLVSPIAETSPELYWQDYVLRSSETSGEEVHLVRASEGIEALKKVTDKADRSRVHVIHVELASEQNYVTPGFLKTPGYPPTKYAYDHPQSPALPADALSATNDRDAAYANEEAALKWLSTDFLPGNSGSRFVSSADLTHIVEPSAGFTVSVAGLQAAIPDFLKAWGTDTFAPPLFRADGHYLSRGELFQALTDMLAEFHRSGKFPESVKVVEVYGPVRVLTGHGPNAGEVTVASIARICAEIAPALHDSSASSFPKNAVPIGVDVEGTMINPAQFLRLMTIAVSNPVPDSKIGIRMVYEFTGLAELIPKSRPNMDDGFVWTLKPALLETGNLQANAGK
jgi:hypothetical protein